MAFDIKVLGERYLNDPAFYHLVSALESMISQHGFVPSELREALFLASYRFEMKNPAKAFTYEDVGAIARAAKKEPSNDR